VYETAAHGSIDESWQKRRSPIAKVSTATRTFIWTIEWQPTRPPEQGTQSHEQPQTFSERRRSSSLGKTV
jgi:hypothetical protein